MNENGIRINKYLAECGICSRRQADEIVNEGRVCVNEEVAVNGTKVYEGMIVTVDGNRIDKEEEKIYLAFNKPRGIVCTSEKKEPDNIIDYLKYPKRITYCGRLDKDSQGLLIMTNDGDLIDSLMRSKNNHEKEYIVTVDKPLTEAFLYKLGKGVYLEELNVTTKPCKVEYIDERHFKIILTQGLNRQIRRMCLAYDYQVTKLKRIRIMGVKLGNLKVGELRPLTKDEIDELKIDVYQS